MALSSDTAERRAHRDRDNGGGELHTDGVSRARLAVLRNDPQKLSQRLAVFPARRWPSLITVLPHLLPGGIFFRAPSVRSRRRFDPRRWTAFPAGAGI